MRAARRPSDCSACRGAEPLAAAPPPPGVPRPLPYLEGYPEPLVEQARALLDAGRLEAVVLERHPQAHTIRSERALQEYVADLKARHLRTAPPVAKVAWDPRMLAVASTLGTHTAISRVQGGRLKAKREIRIASLLQEAPADFLRTLVVHELAHLREREHDRAFYALCEHMEPDYHQWEFDLRLWLTARDARSKRRPAG